MAGGTSYYLLTPKSHRTYINGTLPLKQASFLVFLPPDIATDLFIQGKREAQSFLSFRKQKRGRKGTDVIEECCIETCRTEELKEYCF